MRRTLLWVLLIYHACVILSAVVPQPKSHSDVSGLCRLHDQQFSTSSDQKQRRAVLTADGANQLLDVRIRSRHTMYDSSEISGQLLVTATHPDFRGEALHGAQSSGASSWDFTVLAGSYNVKDLQLASGRISLGTTDRLLKFSLERLTPQLDPYQVRFLLHGPSEHSATTELYYLPAKGYGSSVKIDNLNGGLLVANNSTYFLYEPFIPFAVSGSCSSQWSSSYNELPGYKTLGINTVDMACDSSGHEAAFDAMDAADMWYQYSLESPLQESAIARQISGLKDRTNLLSWEINNSQARTSTEKLYTLLKDLDPYHPVGLAFSCGDSTDALSSVDYVTESPQVCSQGVNAGSNHEQDYPVTEDDVGPQELVHRLDTFSAYLASLENGERPLWATLDAGSEPHTITSAMTEEQLWTAVILTLSRNAKAIILELDQVDEDLAHSYGAIASAIAVPEVSQIMLSGAPSRVNTASAHSLDVSYWRYGGLALVAVANMDQHRIHDNISIELPFSARRIASQPWGSLSWSLINGTELGTYGMDGLATSILVFDT